MKQFNGVYPISGEDLSALPVEAIGPAVEFYRNVLRFAVVSQDEEKATVQRDDARLGLTKKPDHKLGEAGSCAFGVTDLDAMHKELDTLEGRAPIEGDWAGDATGLRGQRVEIAMMRTPDGHGWLELCRFLAPAVVADHRPAPVNALG